MAGSSPGHDDGVVNVIGECLKIDGGEYPPGGNQNRASMKFLVTGSSGHRGEALVRTLRDLDHEVVGLDVVEGPFTTRAGSIADRACVRQYMRGVHAVLHAATLHKPHVATHSRQDFVDTNIVGTLNLLEAAVATGVGSFVYTSKLGWRPRYDFRFIVDRLRAGEDMRSPLARRVGSKGYHAETFADGPYPVE
jgi:hypothetical protein